ncbi:hypothetical protein GH714_004934 [Hevea brasiliensis]|uniref:IREH1/IRE-like N-terminal domain-containing protein n=1 Tax=Hevea brasiliensis TaxID=3981 RepID=A0A6A6M0C8_HEVBR|nr:hypothetical protein GH714_004934 [Hevea brasiliensis]
MVVVEEGAGVMGLETEFEMRKERWEGVLLGLRNNNGLVNLEIVIDDQEEERWVKDMVIVLVAEVTASMVEDARPSKRKWAKFDKLKEEVDSDLGIFAGDLVGILEKARTLTPSGEKVWRICCLMPHHVTLSILV